MKELWFRFPLLRNLKSQGHFAYLDNASTTQKPDDVISAIKEHYHFHTANIHRGFYPLAHKASAKFEEAREIVADYFGVDKKGVIFTGGSTSSLNQIALGLEHHFTPDSHIVISEMEHHSNILPWQRLADRTGARLHWVPVLNDGRLDFEAYEKTLSQNPVKLVALTAVSHVLGTINPVLEFTKLAKKYKALTVIDAAQSSLRDRQCFLKYQADAVVFSGHKIFGPSGIGGICATSEFLDQMEPTFLGGGMWGKDSPWLFEGGTPPIEQAVSLGRALQFADALTPDYFRQEEVLIRKFAKFLSSFPEVEMFGWPCSDGYQTPHSALLSFSLKNLHCHDLADLLGDDGVAVRAGLHCAHPLHRKLQSSGTVRISLAPYNTLEDFDIFARAFERVLNFRKNLGGGTYESGERANPESLGG